MRPFHHIKSLEAVIVGFVHQQCLSQTHMSGSTVDKGGLAMEMASNDFSKKLEVAKKEQ